MKMFSGAALAAMLLAAPAWAQMGAAKEGSGETPRGAQVDDATLKAAQPIPLPKVEDEAARAAPMLDDAAAAKAYGAVTRGRDGAETRSEASEALKNAIKNMNAAPATQGGADASGTSGSGIGKNADPAAEGERQVFGADDRVQITSTKTYPFSAIGYIEGKNKAGAYGSCSGTLIGPRTVITAAHCLYDHENGGWLDEVIFVPGMNGPEDAPFGGYPYESATIVQGYLDNYQGFYGSVVPWDLGVLTLAEPVGDYVGWLGYSHVEGLGDFNANIVGYPGDKPAATMWRATCDVIAENILSDAFTYDCDTFPGSSGSSVYAYDPGTKSRVVLGVNVAESQAANVAVRLNAAYVEWINSLYK